MILPLLVVVSGLIAYQTADGGTRGNDQATIILLPFPVTAPLTEGVRLGTAGSKYLSAETDARGHYSIPNVTPGYYIVYTSTLLANVDDPYAKISLESCQQIIPRFYSNRRVHCDLVSIKPGDNVESSWTSR